MNKECCEKCNSDPYGNDYASKEHCTNKNCPCHHQEKDSWQTRFIKRFFVYKLGGEHPDHVGAEKEAIHFISEERESAKKEERERLIGLAKIRVRNLVQWKNNHHSVVSNMEFVLKSEVLSLLDLLNKEK